MGCSGKISNKYSQCDIYSGVNFVPEKAWHKTTTSINSPVTGVSCHCKSRSINENKNDIDFSYFSSVDWL